VQEIRLEPLGRADLGQLIADALHCESERVALLTQLVQEKTDGNPFFVIQFLHALAEEGLLAFDHDTARWRWDLHRIHDKGYTDNVVDLLVRELSRLPVETQQALQQMACLGNTAETAMLTIILGTSEEEVHAALWRAVRQELVERLDGSYKFVHDRVPEAAYSLIPEALRAEVHLRIGRLLLAQTPEKRGGGDLRGRGSAQPRHRADHAARGTGPSRRAQPDRGQARERLVGVRRRAHLSYCRGLAAGG
jgi:predicted ATPase